MHWLSGSFAEWVKSLWLNNPFPHNWIMKATLPRCSLYGSFAPRAIGYFAGDHIAHIKYTVLLMPNGSDRITSHAMQQLQPTKSW
ncbi:ERBB-3 BINDING PROTEIN 1-like [Cucurbita pepo subsp. pepo]|uniref:ERBB-3 BINDING PROTEIN 1-like n=1 Tax=Cucurbita pepo subsp. pepo TaxID=3664 RepID=UPI000C9D81D2|nr:ERBB-3 BINDING PROTEIN 1-like [Cucurbita pepo subsp. pepo]